MKQLLLLVTSWLLSVACLAQENGIPISAGTELTIQSSVLGEPINIQVYTPDTYTDSKQEYPALYILDGHRYFLNGVAIQKTIKNPRAIPEMIVVGITTDESRYRWFGYEKKKFTSFLTNELIPFIDTNYKTSNDRLIFGWEAGAFYSSEMLLQHQEIFNGAIIANGGYAPEDVVKDFSSDRPTYLYMANSRKDIYSIDSSEELHDILSEKNPEDLVWTYDLINEEIHESLTYMAMYKGLKFYYHNYNSLVFESVQQYIDMGGMEYLTSYFNERAERFGLDAAIDSSTKNALIWLAWKRDNFEYFQRFMTEFEDVLSTRRYASAYWQNRFGQFYLKHKDYPNAIKYFHAGLTNYPDSSFEEQMKEGLGKAKRMKD